MTDNAGIEKGFVGAFAWKNLNAILYHKDLLLEGRWQEISYLVSFVF